MVQRILEVSEQRRSLKPSALLFAYALCARSNDKDTKTAAYSHISKICRTPTFLFMFIKFCEEISNPEGVEGKYCSVLFSVRNGFNILTKEFYQMAAFSAF